MTWILIAITVVTLCVPLFISKIRSFHSTTSNCSSSFLSNGDRRNVLLVIAHPDDESMFFAPTILFLASERHSLHVLCLSTGDAEGKGNVRKEELYRACAIFKIPPRHVKIFDHPNLQDGFGHSWDHQLIATIVEEEIRTHDIDTLLTFDNFGVSGHRNHRDVHHGICKLLQENSQRIEAWELISTSILRKYIGPLDIWLSTCFQSCQKERVYFLINSHPNRSYLAMAEHYSQWIWFRKLFVLFSRYTYMNTLRKINFEHSCAVNRHRS